VAKDGPSGWAEEGQRYPIPTRGPPKNWLRPLKSVVASPDQLLLLLLLLLLLPGGAVAGGRAAAPCPGSEGAGGADGALLPPAPVAGACAPWRGSCILSGVPCLVMSMCMHVPAAAAALINATTCVHSAVVEWAQHA
jgi:hypothetical protein